MMFIKTHYNMCTFYNVSWFTQSLWVRFLQHSQRSKFRSVTTWIESIVKILTVVFEIKVSTFMVFPKRSFTFYEKSRPACCTNFAKMFCVPSIPNDSSWNFEVTLIFFHRELVLSLKNALWEVLSGGQTLNVGFVCDERLSQRLPKYKSRFRKN